METVFHLNANDLYANFVEGLKKLFSGQNIVISVAAEADTTDYLLSDPARKALLLKSIAEAESGNLLAIKLTDYQS